MNAPDHDLDEPQFQDVNAWRGVLTGLSLMRFALLALLCGLLVPFVLVPIFAVPPHHLPAWFAYTALGVIAGVLLMNAIILLLGMAFCCAAPANFRARRHSRTAFALTLVLAGLVSTWIAWIVLMRQNLLPRNWIDALIGGRRYDLINASLASAAMLLVIFIVALWCRFLQDVAEAFDQAALAQNVGFFKWWFCILSSGAVLAPVLEILVPFRDEWYPLIAPLAVPSMINVPVSIAWGAALVIDTRNMLHKALRSP